MKNDTKFTNVELIQMYEGSNKGSRNSELNYNKLKNNGIPANSPIELNNGVVVAFFPRHGGIEKGYYWHTRVIKKETALRRVMKGSN